MLQIILEYPFLSVSLQPNFIAQLRSYNDKSPINSS